ncbi:MAG: PD-(D/E)XK nuclease family protein, partial [Crocinitomicaceae bacterium]|nr:PD-(D/E)XK nuclease family protein [Crocinitomicaceae bacterium]
AVIPIKLEENIEAEIETTLNGKNQSIKLRGQADRIDKVGGLYRILDYKSGTSDESKLKLSAKNINADGMEALLSDDNKRYARQLLMYGLMFRYTFPELRPFSAGILSMVKISEWIHFLREGDTIEISDELLDTFQAALVEKISELYLPDFEFKHNPDSKYCQHCEK